jgi:hypothetical protein
VHLPLGEQREDRGTDVAAPTAAATAGTATTATATEGARPEAGAAGSEAGEIAAAETGKAGAAVLTQVFTEPATGVPALVVQGATVSGGKAESETGAGLPGERAILGGEWGVHGWCLSFDVEERYRIPIR